jgi:cold shock CspA family protein
MVSNKLRRDTGAVGLDTLMGVLGARVSFQIETGRNGKLQAQNVHVVDAG